VKFNQETLQYLCDDTKQVILAEARGEGESTLSFKDRTTLNCMTIYMSMR